MPSPTRPGGRREYLRRKLFGGNFWGRLNTRIVGQMYVDRGSDPSGTVLLAGSARAGTTWISDILNYRNEYRYIFEPFHPNRLATTRGFRPRQYLRPDNDDPAYLLPATDILSGRVRSVWTDKYNRKRVASRRLVKEVRGNLLLGWISSQFPQVPIILLLRHPCAVVNSQLDLKWNWHLDLRDFLSQSPLMEDHLEPFRDLMTSTTERFDQHVLLWCIENYVPLRQFRPGDVHVAFYEHFCVDPAREIERMFSFLGKPFDPAAMANLSKPSAVSRKTSAIVSGESLVESWRKKVGDAQVARAEEILGAFGLDRVYGADPLPKLAAASGALSGGGLEMKTLGDSALGQVGRRLAGQLYVDRDRDHSNSVFLAGSGRSGTTWVADIINYRNDYRYIFEPFHRHKVPVCAPFKYRQYLRPDDADPIFREPARRILTGDVRNLWTDKYNRKRVSSRRLLKDVRANLFLKWMNVQFPGMPIVLLLRHPCAVASSRLKVDWQGGADLRQFLAQPRLVEDHLAPFRDAIAGAEDDYARMIFFWCVENYVPLRQFSPGQIHVLFYEALCVEPEREIERLFAFLGTPFDPHVLRSVARPSSATRKDSAIVSGESLIGGWTKHLSSEQVTRALEILELFELDRIYGSSPTPTAEVAEQAFSS